MRDEDRGALAAVEVTVSSLALVGSVVVIGLAVSWVRLAAARLPFDLATSALGVKALFGVGVRSVAAMAVVFAALCLFAYLSSARKWDVNGQDWHDIVREGGVASARGRDGYWSEHEAREAYGEKIRHGRRADRLEIPVRLTSWFGPLHSRLEAARERHREAALAPVPTPRDLRPAPIGVPVVRILAGFNILVIAAVVGLAAARVAELILPHTWWVILAVWAVSALLVHRALTELGPLWFRPWVHKLVWVLVAAAAAFVAAPLGILILTGMALSTAGRALARQPAPTSASRFLRSPLPWALLSAYTLVAFAYYATPPVSFPRAVITTQSGDRLGGLLSRTGPGTYLVTCTPLANATSTDERVEFIPAAQVKGISVGGTEDSLDDGQRPSLLSLALSGLGVDAHPPTLVRFDIRARRATCAGAPPAGLTVGTEDPALGAGAIDGPAPAGGQANDGESPIEKTTPAAIARLAKLYQPTMELTVTDRFWPVSVGALLKDIGPDGQRTCLVSSGSSKCVTATSFLSLNPVGSTAPDYLRFPAARKSDPTDQFQAFERGQYVPTGSLEDWLADPGLLDPWYTAQVYFYYAGPVNFAHWPTRNPDVPAGLIGLQYWFFYPYNYYPTAVGAELMNAAPLAGDLFNTDLHQGDWEHVTVLLNPSTLDPEWLYMARHANEGEFYPWSSPSLTFDHGHPIVQGAFGGHPSYPNACGGQPRKLLKNLSSDWVVCGSGRFAFRAATTPLVDLARTSWGCWKGHFGEAPPGGVNDPDQVDKYFEDAKNLVYVDGPPSPLWQAENGSASQGTGVCQSGDPAAAEDQALRSRAGAAFTAAVSRLGR